MAAMMTPSFPGFDVRDDTTAGQRWPKWLARFENFAVAYRIKDPAEKRAMLLHSAGEDVYEIFQNLPDTGDADEYDKATQALTKHFQPKKCVEYQVYLFRDARQNSGESLDSYYARLRELAKHCNFTEEDREIKTQIIQHCNSTRLRRRALRDELTLHQLIEAGRALELSERQAEQIENNSDTKFKEQDDKGAINALQKNKQHFQKRNSAPQSGITRQCYGCGHPYPHNDRPCPAMGKTCYQCGKVNHFGRVCRQRIEVKDDKRSTQGREERKYVPQKWHGKVNKLETNHSDSDNSDEEFACLMNIGEKKAPKVFIRINDRPLEMLVDTGAPINVLPEGIYDKQFSAIQLKSTSLKILPYGTKDPLPIKGKFTAEVKTDRASCKTEIYVVQRGSLPLMSYQTATELGIVSIVNTIDINANDAEFKKILNEFPEVTNGIGKLKDVQVRVHLNENVPPTVNTRYRIPFNLREKVEERLLWLEDRDIIERAEGPTTWVSPLVIAPKKNGDIRICVDLRAVNEAVNRERHIMPTIDEVTAGLANMSKFSKFDMPEGYLQIELAPECRHITTFATHTGLWRFKRLPYGLNVSSEIFQKEIERVIRPVRSARNVSDDILVATAPEASHADQVRATLQQFKEAGLTIKPSKCSYMRSSLKYLGMIFSENGIAPDPEKIEAIRSLKKPTNISELRSLLGMTTYCSRFIPNYATISTPLRNLTRKEADWQWTAKEDSALNEIVKYLQKASITAFFDKNKFTEIVVDASPTGLGAILTQKTTPTSDEFTIVAYASKSLTDVERRYSQTEREALAVVWGAEHFHLYVFGSNFKIITDHKPLESIYNKNTHQAPARIERWRARLHGYDATIEYRPGKDNPADYLSRQERKSTTLSDLQVIADEYISFTLGLITEAINIERVRKETRKDPFVQSIIQTVVNNSWEKALRAVDGNTLTKIQSYYKVRQELSVTSDGSLLLRGKQLVVPERLQDEAIEIAHEGHQGLIKTKQFLRESLWFPGIDRKVEILLANCLACQAASPRKENPPVQMSKLPDHPWQELSADFAGPFPSGEYILVVIDDHSRFPEIEIVRSTSNQAVCPKLDKIFASYGIPEVLRTDNGPPFNSHEFAAFAKKLGFHHRKIMPLWPRANGIAERFMRTLGKMIKAATAQGKNWKMELATFLRNYRATPHASTTFSPAEVMFGRRIHTKLPSLVRPKRNGKLERIDEKSKRHMAEYQRRHATTPKIIRIGDTVLCRNEKKTKTTPHYRPRPMAVTAVKGNMITAAGYGKITTRHSSFFKVISSTCAKGDEWEEKSDDDDDDGEPQHDGYVGDNREPPQGPNPVLPHPPIPPRRNPRRERRPPARLICEV